LGAYIVDWIPGGKFHRRTELALSGLRKDLGGALLPFSAVGNRAEAEANYTQMSARAYTMSRYCRRPAQQRRVCTCQRNRRCPTHRRSLSLGRIPIQSAPVVGTIAVAYWKKGCGAAASFGSMCYQAAKTSFADRPWSAVARGVQAGRSRTRISDPPRS
jgi:hypothetical protein